MYCVSVPKYEYDDKDDVLSLFVDDDDEFQLNAGFYTNNNQDYAYIGQQFSKYCSE